MEAYSAISLISIGLTTFYVGVVAFFIRGWMRLPLVNGYRTGSITSVSVVIAARNEAIGISKTIECLLAQDYPDSLYEVIVVDDHSTDDTATIVRSFGQKGVRLIQLHEDALLNSYKKKAITLAIEQAKGDMIVATDADCVMGSSWLSAVMAYYERSKYKLISSPVQFYEERNLFERCQSLEFLYLIGLGASTIGNKRPSTCNGANLAYERKVFYEVGGFKGIDDLASGDDELLLHKIAERYPGQIGFLKSREARVYTHAKPNLKELIRQRKRWASKSTKYKNKGLILLGVVMWIFNLSLLLNIGLSAFDTRFLMISVYQFAFKITAELVFLIQVTRFADRRRLLILLPLVSIFHVVYLVCIGVLGNSGAYQWKGRKVK